MKSSYDTLSNENEKKHCSRECKLKISGSLIITILFITYLIVIFINYKFDSNNDSNNIAASLYYNRHHHHDCNEIDYVYQPKNNRYGCCQFKDNLNKTYTISLFVTIKRDESGSNCPTYDHLIYNYIDYIVTYPIYFDIKEDIVDNCIINNITLPLDKKHCPSTYTIQSAYENYYISPYSDLLFLGIVIAILFCFIICCNN